MKQLICCLLSVLLVFTLSGCNSGDSGDVSFYYCRDPQQYRYFSEDSVISIEPRDLLGHRNDLRYMLGLYLAGPLEEGLVNPFTKATRLLSAEKKDNVIFVELSGHNKILTDSEFSLACACLTLTCMDFTPCDGVTIISGERTITMDADSILLSDTLPLQETTGG